MAETVNPTKPGPHNHLGNRIAPRDTPAPQIDKVFGVDAPIIEGLPIEVGHGCKSISWQLAEHVLRIFATEGREASRALMLKLLTNKTINQGELAVELIARNLLSQKAAAGRRALEAFAPAGPGN